MPLSPVSVVITITASHGVPPVVRWPALRRTARAAARALRTVQHEQTRMREVWWLISPLSAEVTGDPATRHGGDRPDQPAGRLPETLDQALAALRQSDVIGQAMGPMLYNPLTAVRAAEAESFRGQDPDAIAAAHRRDGRCR